MGHIVERGPLPFDVEQVNALWPIIGQISLAHLRRLDPRFDKDAGPKYRAMADRGEAIPAFTLYQLLETFVELRRDVSAAFAHFDFIMTPSCAAQPWPAEDAFPTTIDGRAVGPRGHAVTTAWVNAAHHPAIAIPTGIWTGPLPVGFQLVGDLGTEEALIDLAEAYEANFLVDRRWPACAY